MARASASKGVRYAVVGLGHFAQSAILPAFAHAPNSRLTALISGDATKLEELKEPPKEPKSGGSDDIGDVSWNLPTITLRYPSNIPNLPGHNWANAIAMATPIAHKGNIAGSKVVAMTLLDLLNDKSLLPKVKTYFATVSTKDQKYVAMLSSTDVPAKELNSETMNKYQAELKKYYYDPSRYGTYLEQLAIPFPTLEKPPAGN